MHINARPLFSGAFRSAHRAVLILFMATMWLSGIAFSHVSAAPVANDDSAFLFTSFRDADQKYLRFLYSYDGYHWTNVPGTFLEAHVGVSQQFRDPSISRGPDGVFTSSGPRAGTRIRASVTRIPRI
jgi:hypothetical protein